MREWSQQIYLAPTAREIDSINSPYQIDTEMIMNGLSHVWIVDIMRFCKGG